MKTTLSGLCNGYSKNIALKDLINNNGTYPIYGASGYIKNVDFYVSDCEYLGIVKDGAGVGRVDKYPAYSSLLGTMQYIVPNADVDIDYLKYLLISLHLENGVSGAAIPHIYYKNYKNLRVNVCEKTNQIQIARQLDAICNGISLSKSIVALLDELVKSRFIEMFGYPFTNEKGYPLLTIDDVMSFQGGSQPDKKYFEYTKTDENVRLIQIRDYKTDKFITYIPKSMAKRYCTKEDIMIGRYGPPIFQILQGIEGSYNVALMKAIPKMGNRDFIRYFLKQDCLLEYLQQYCKRVAGQDGIQMDKLKEFPFPYPPIELQNEYAEFVKLIDKSKFVCHSKNFLCDIFTFSSSTIAYPSVVSIFVCPKRC